MRTFCTRFVRTAAALAVAMLFGAPSFAQTAVPGKVNTEREPVPSAGAKQNPPSPPSAKGPATLIVNTEREPVPSAGAKQNPPSPPSAKGPATPIVGPERDPLATEPTARKTKEERMAARAKRKADRAERAAKRPPTGGEALKY